MNLRQLSTVELFERSCAGDRRAIGRLLTIAEHGGDPADSLSRLTHPRTGNAHIVGITGAPGAGKSTITGQLAARGEMRQAILAIDPSSPLTGGAILGDRIRMDNVIDDPDTFIRSMATRGHGGGLALAVPAAVRLLDAVGFDLVVVETVGVGQVEVEVAAAADTTVVVVTPGWGDAVQANKAGLLEVADVFVVNKSDRPGASDARRDLELMLDLSGHPEPDAWRPPIVLVTATKGEGIAELQEQIAAHQAWLTNTGNLEQRRSARMQSEVRDRLLVLLAEAGDKALIEHSDLLGQVDDRELSPDAAAHQISEGIIGGTVDRPGP